MEQLILREDDVNTVDHGDLAARRCQQAMVLRTLKNGEEGDRPSARGGTHSLPVGQVHGGESSAPPPCTDVVLPGRERSTPMSEIETFVPGLVAHSLAQAGLPTHRELAVLFVDIADSTRTVVRQSPEVALVVVQRFMRLVTEIALSHCGDVKDYEGDGALLYFGSIVQAAKAALAIRTALGEEQQSGNLPVQARLSVHVGDVIIGEIGSPLRRSVAVIGPAVSQAARLLKHIPPGGIIVPQTVVERLQHDAPEVAAQFHLLGSCLVLRGFEEECVIAYHIPPLGAPVLWSRSVNENSSYCNTPVSIP